MRGSVAGSQRIDALSLALSASLASRCISAEDVSSSSMQLRELRPNSRPGMSWRIFLSCQQSASAKKGINEAKSLRRSGGIGEQRKKRKRSQRKKNGSSAKIAPLDIAAIFSKFGFGNFQRSLLIPNQPAPSSTVAAPRAEESSPRPAHKEPSEKELIELVDVLPSDWNRLTLMYESLLQSKSLKPEVTELHIRFWLVNALEGSTVMDGVPPMAQAFIDKLCDLNFHLGFPVLTVLMKDCLAALADGLEPAALNRKWSSKLVRVLFTQLAEDANCTRDYDAVMLQLLNSEVYQQLVPNCRDSPPSIADFDIVLQIVYHYVIQEVQDGEALVARADERLKQDLKIEAEKLASMAVDKHLISQSEVADAINRYFAERDWKKLQTSSKEENDAGTPRLYYKTFSGENRAYSYADLLPHSSWNLPVAPELGRSMTMPTLEEASESLFERRHTMHY